MTNKPTLAVRMANFNHSAYIGRAIEAIATQSRRPDEFTIIDDASTDDSRIIIEKYREKYPWITVIYQNVNTGILEIMQRAIREVKSDYLFMAAADDYVLPYFFARAMEGAKLYPNAGILFGQMRIENSEGMYMYTGKAREVSISSYLSPTEYRQNYLEREPVTQSLSAATIFRVSALNFVGGFHTQLGSWCDTFTIQAISLTYGAYYIACPVSVAVMHAQAFSQKNHLNPSSMFTMLKTADKLMKSHRFRHLFPSSYVRIWSIKFHIAIIVRYIVALSPRAIQAWYAFILHKVIYKVYEP